MKDGMAEISVKLNENAMFFEALQYGAYVEVLEPKILRNRIKKEVNRIVKV